MSRVLFFLFVCLASTPTAAQQSTWWHGKYVNAGGTNCDGDSQIVFSADAVRPWEGYCTVSQQVDLRDITGVLLDVRSCSAEGEEYDGDDRVLLIELSSGNVVRYSSRDKVLFEMQRCSE